MKISAFVTVSNPIERQDPFYECFKNMFDFADEVVLVRGEQTGEVMKTPFDDEMKVKTIWYEWPEEFDWKFIGEQFQRGYDACTGDIVFRFDADYFLHEDSFEDIKTFLADNPDHPAYSMPKKQFLLVNKFRVKSLVPVAFNKGKYGDRIKLNGGGDLCQPTLDGKELNLCHYGQVCDKNSIPIISRKDYVIIDDELNQSQVLKRLPNLVKKDDKLYTQYRGIPFFNYDFSFKEKHIIKKDFARFARAWNKTFEDWHLGGPDEDSAYECFINMQVGRYKSGGWTDIDIENHPKYIKDKVKNIKPEQFGYNMFGEL